MEILEEIPFKYFLYKKEDGHIFLSVTHIFTNIAIPIKIIHRLDDNDIKEYHNSKELYLSNQIEQMRKSPQNYDTQSWR